MHWIFITGLGTRFLPATKAMPKEMLPVVGTSHRDTYRNVLRTSPGYSPSRFTRYATRSGHVKRSSPGVSRGWILSTLAGIFLARVVLLPGFFRES